MNYYAVEKSSFLSHHGILGQKWGIRRFQNKDGSLTKAGKIRYTKDDGSLNEAGKQKYLTADGHLTEEGKAIQKEVLDNVVDKQPDDAAKARLNEMLKQYGIEQGKAEDVIKKGSEMTRLAGEEDKIDDKRKYVSLTKWDNEQYEADSEFLPMGANPQQFKYEALKDLRVAKPGDVCEYVVEKYGDMKVSEVASLVKSQSKSAYAYSGWDVDSLIRDYGSITMREIHAQEKELEKVSSSRWGFANANGADGSKDLKWLRDRSDFLTRTYDDFIHQKIAGVDPESANKTFNEFKKRGYDAIVDPEDSKNEIFQYPVILLNPKTSVKQKSKKALLDLWAERYG